MRFVVSVLTLLILSLAVAGQSLSASQITKLSNDYLPRAIRELREFVQLKNDGHYPDQIKENLAWCLNAMQKRKYQTMVLESDNVPHLFAQRIYNEKLPTILFYLQIDGQPVNATEWDQPDPYKATLKQMGNGRWTAKEWGLTYGPDDRIFARSISDSKGPAIAFLAALDILDQKRITPAFNIKIIMDFQEEMGSPTLPELVARNKELFKARMVLIMDGTRHISNLPTLNFGARGIATVKLKIFGANTELHSGQYGNYAPNPVFKLAKLLAGMKDDSGRVLISGFYDGINLSEKEKELINDMPGNDIDLNKRLGIARSDQVGSTYEEALQYPSLNVRGLQAASVGNEARTVIPSEALAEIDMRLVPETPGERQVALLKKYIESQGYHIVDDTPTDEERSLYSNLISFEYRIGSKPFRTDLNSPEGVWLSQAMDRVFGPGKYVRQRTTGGSQPIEPFISAMGIPAISLRIPNPDNNIHAANENLRIGNFREGIQMCLGILTQKLN